jgi:hypothetical protein
MWVRFPPGPQEEVEEREYARKREVYLKSGVGKEFLNSNFKQIDK